MYKFDENFLTEVGLADLPAEQKAGFLEYAQDQLEIRVGEKLSENLSDEQIKEFEKIIEGDQNTISGILAKFGDYKNDDLYQAMLRNGVDSSRIETEYVSAKWLSINCPDYEAIIKKTMEELREEIKSNKDAILTA